MFSAGIGEAVTHSAEATLGVEFQEPLRSSLDYPLTTRSLKLEKHHIYEGSESSPTFHTAVWSSEKRRPMSWLMGSPF